MSLKSLLHTFTRAYIWVWTAWLGAENAKGVVKDIPCSHLRRAFWGLLLFTRMTLLLDATAIRWLGEGKTSTPFRISSFKLYTVEIFGEAIELRRSTRLISEPACMPTFLILIQLIAWWDYKSAISLNWLWQRRNGLVVKCWNVKTAGNV